MSLDKSKVFCIGANKTGTESLKHFLEDLGYIFGDQLVGEKLLYDIKNDDYNQMLELSKTAEAFKDIPFNIGKSYQYLDQEYPDAKFILTVRNSEAWFNSLYNFHSQWFFPGHITTELLKDHIYTYDGWFWDYYHHFLNFDENYDALGNKENIIGAYEAYNNAVIEYFNDRPGKLLIIDIQDQGKTEQICNFLNINNNDKQFPHLHKKIYY